MKYGITIGQKRNILKWNIPKVKNETRKNQKQRMRLVKF